MFRPKTHCELNGSVDGIDVRISITAEAKQAHSSLGISTDRPVVAQVHNFATYLFTAVNAVLKQLEENGAQGLLVQAKPTPTESAKVLDFSALKQSQKDTDDGKGH